MIEIIEPGILNTIQDGGRWGYQSLGVPVSGAMDLPALRAGNQLVVNAPDEAALEIHSPIVMQTDQPHLVAVTGAGVGFLVNGRMMPEWMSVFVRGGSIIEIAPHHAGWVYLAVHGGVDVPRVLGSKSMYLRGGFGGIEGRALSAGDAIPIGRMTIGELLTFAGKSARDAVHQFATHSSVRVILGPHSDRFTDQAITTFTSTPYTLTASADRMGYRFRGAPLARKREGELVSCGVPLGAIQVPPDGQPIVLMADHQTTGGYPIIATVMAEDIPVVAQCAPGAALSFEVAKP
jgi:antagonist of KipI